MGFKKVDTPVGGFLSSKELCCLGVSWLAEETCNPSCGIPFPTNGNEELDTYIQKTEI